MAKGGNHLGAGGGELTRCLTSSEGIPNRWPSVHYRPGLSCAAQHPSETETTGDHVQLEYYQGWTFYSRADLHHHETRRRQSDPHPKIIPSGALPSPNLQRPKTPSSARENDQNYPVRLINK